MSDSTHTTDISDLKVLCRYNRQSVVDAQNTTVACEWFPGCRVVDFAPSSFNPFVDMCWLNGEKVESSDWSSRPVWVSDQILFEKDPAGVGGFLIAGLQGALGATGVTIVGGVIDILLSTGVTTLLGSLIGEPDAPEPTSAETFSFTGAKTLVQEGAGIPVCYGRHKMGGNLISKFRTLRGPRFRRGIGTEVIDLVISYGHGPINKIGVATTDLNASPGSDFGDSITIDNVNIDQLPETRVWTRLGSKTQDFLPSKRDQVTIQSVDRIFDRPVFRNVVPSGGGPAVPTVINPDPIVIATTKSGATTVEIVLEFPDGWYRLSHGSPTSAGYRFTFEIGATGSGVYSFSQTFAASYFQIAPFFDTFRLTVPTALVSGLLDIRLTNRTQPGVTEDRQHVIKEFRLLQPGLGTNYGYQALLNLRADASENVFSQSVRFRDIIPIIEGKKVYQWDGVDSDPQKAIFTYGYTTSLADCMMDFILNTRYGGGADNDLTHVDLQSFKDLRDFHNELVSDGFGGTQKRLEIGLVIDEDKPFGEWLRQMAFIGRCSVIRIGRKFKVKIDRPSSPVQLFTMGDIIEGSFGIQYLSKKGRPDQVVVEYTNADKDFERDEATVPEESPFTTRDTGFKIERVPAFGITNRKTALDTGQYVLRQMRSLDTVINFAIGVDGIESEPGDVIAFQHDLPNWKNTGGRVISSTATTITVDRDITLEGGIHHKITVRTIGTGSTVLQERTIGFDGTQTFTAGTAIPGIDPAFTTGDLPQRGDGFAIGQELPTQSHVREYRVIRMVPQSDFTVRVQAVNYDPTVYDEYTGEVGVAEDLSTAANDTKDIRRPFAVAALPFARTLPDGSTDYGFTVTWQSAQGSSAHRHAIFYRENQRLDSNIQVLEDGDHGWILAGESTDQSFEVSKLDPQLAPGAPKLFEVSVAAIYPTGLVQSPGKGGRTAVVIQDVAPFDPPPSPTNLTILDKDEEILMTWDPPSDTTQVKHYELRRGTQWQTAQYIKRTEETSVRARDWAINAVSGDTFMVRAVSHAGKYSGDVATLQANLDFPRSHLTTDIQYDQDDSPPFSGGTKTNMSLVGSALEIDSGQTTASYVSAQNASANDEIHLYTVLADITVTDDALTWDNFSTYWDDVSTNWEDTDTHWDDFETTWQSKEACETDWESNFVNPPFTITLEEAFSDGSSPVTFGSYQRHRPGRDLYEISRCRVSFTRRDDDVDLKLVRLEQTSTEL